MSAFGFIGLGTMGYHMAHHLCKMKDVDVYVWNRTQSKALKHAKEFGTTAATTLSDVAERCDVVFMCLPNSQIVENVIDEMIKGKVRDGLIIVDCTSGDPAITRMCGEKLSKIDAGFVDAPVSGGPKTNTEKKPMRLIHPVNSIKGLSLLATSKCAI